MDFLKVSSKSSPASVAGAIAGMVKDGVDVNIQCVGAGAVNVFTHTAPGRCNMTSAELKYDIF